MLNITIPEGFFEERKYIVDVMFKEFLGLNFTIKSSEKISFTSVQLENGKQLDIDDDFFSKIHSLNEDYLHAKNIPKEVISYDLDNAPEKNIIGLFGKPEVTVFNTKISCKIDLLASAFYMLTRWEEYVIRERDRYGRFPANLSLAYKNKFLSRPIINEYVEVIWSWLKSLGINQTRKERNFQFINTHDIDKIKLFEKQSDYIAKPIKALLTDKNLTSLIHHSKLAIQSYRGKDPYLVFDYLMDTSERCNIKSHFFFMSTKVKTKYDNGYDITDTLTNNIINNIIKRGHVIGIHPSFETLNNPDLLSREIKKLRQVTQTDVVCGRQHYLRFDLPNTWQHWEDNKMKWDSSLAYSEQEGFRCGVCYSFPVFNILTCEVLSLWEKPLTIMDGTLEGARQLSPEQSMDIINYYIDKVKLYSGEFVFLWHNSSFEYLNWKNFRQVFESTCQYSQNNLKKTIYLKN